MLRKKFSADFKARVAVDVIKNDATIPELSKKYGVHPTQIKAWEKTLLDNAENLFSKKKHVVEDQSDYIEALERKTGQLALENDFLKKKLNEIPKKERLMMIVPACKDLSIRSQCEILGINRSNLYYDAISRADESVLANEIRDIWLEWPQYGYRKITEVLRRNGHEINHKKILRIMQAMDIQAMYPKQKTSHNNPAHRIYPYLLRDLEIVRPNQVWATDITYIKMPEGFMYLVALIDWFSRYVISWNFSNTLETRFCEEMLLRALESDKPEILNTDQGCQFTSEAWINLVQKNSIKVSMDGKGRWADNIVPERFWRTLKYEHVLLHEFESVPEARNSIGQFIDKYNYKRLHQSLGYRPPAEVYFLSKTGGQNGS